MTRQRHGLHTDGCAHNLREQRWTTRQPERGGDRYQQYEGHIGNIICHTNRLRQGLPRKTLVIVNISITFVRIHTAL